ncbi:MAG: LuxR family transcriptional regulator [Alphaproteobacteria bacterium]|nr:LuxR family transcriptional regulator [Alphaproteobacteria bacterium]
MPVTEALTALDAAQTTDDLRGIADNVVRRFGFGGFTYHLYRPGVGSLVYIGDWQPEWLQRYEDKGYIDIDPVVEQLLRTVTPFLWTDTVLTREVNAPERVVLNEARAFSMKAGAEIPVHEPGLGCATFSLFSASEATFTEAWSQHRHNMHIFALYFHQRYVNLLELDGTEQPPPLSKRERECLAWTSRGKTAWEIGEILHISERTVKVYLDTATRKLGSFSKHHAVVKAILNRIILP